MLRTTMQLPKVVRTWCVLHILTWKCASCHNGVHFFISHLARWLGTRRFSEPTFQPSWLPTNKSWEKNTVFRDFPNISRACVFFLLTLSLSLFCSSLFYSLFSDSSHLCFSSLHIVGSLTCRLPLTILVEVWIPMVSVQMNKLLRLLRFTPLIYWRQTRCFGLGRATELECGCNGLKRTDALCFWQA